METKSLELLWGAAAIAKAIGRTERATFHALEKGELPGARKIAGRWCFDPAVFREYMRGRDSSDRKTMPVDDPSRSFSDSVLPSAMIFAGAEMLKRADDDLRNYKAGETIDWDYGMIAVATYRAMTAACPEDF